MMKAHWSKEKILFIEEMARSCEQAFGLPRMGGRIWAVLLISSKEYLSSDELMDEVQASRGSVSTMVRVLESIGLVKRVKLRGDRKYYYSATEAESLMHTELGSMKVFIRLMEVGARALDKKDKRAQERIKEIRLLMEFFVKEYAELLERWHNQKANQ
jgi:DNA-binding transcriptional regulator GbsR (MarR family)